MKLLFFKEQGPVEILNLIFLPAANESEGGGGGGGGFACPSFCPAFHPSVHPSICL